MTSDSKATCSGADSGGVCDLMVPLVCVVSKQLLHAGNVTM